MIGEQARPRTEPTRLAMLDTLATPNMVAVDASEHRAALASRNQVLSLSLDAVMTARAGKSIEKMLCHQVAALHNAGMELLVRLQETATGLPPRTGPPGQRRVARIRLFPERV